MKRRGLIAMLLICAILFTACAAPAAEATPSAPADTSGEETTTAETTNEDGEPIFITIGTAAIGGAFYPLGMAMAKMWNEDIPNMKAVAIATAGSPQNIDMLRTEDIEVAVCRSTEAYNAIHGVETYSEPIPYICALKGGLYYDCVQILAVNDDEINSISDFKGKRIAVGSVGSGGESDARSLLAAYGMTYDDITPEYIEVSQAVDMMKDGLLDGAILGITLGSSAINELMMTGKVKIIDIDEAAIDKLRENESWIENRTIPANTYQNQDYEVKSFGRPPDVIICREDMDEELAYQLCKSMYENAETIHGVTQILEQFGTDMLTPADEAIVPYHPGALRYFQEIGVLD